MPSLAPNLTLVLNCGSSSIKCCLINTHLDINAKRHTIAQGLLENIGQANAQLTWTLPKTKTTALPHADHQAAMAALFESLEKMGYLKRIAAIGHRVVHGGTRFKTPTRINPKVIAQLHTLIPLAPLHNPANIMGIEMAQQHLPHTPQVAVFDTSFHQSLPPHAFRYAIPEAWHTEHHVRRFGFHGISHQYIAEATALTLQQPLDQIHIISAHLGNGGSVCAINRGKSVDTSMGLTPLEGLVMGTRCGDLDPGVHAYLCDQLNIDVHTLTHELNHASGLLGLSDLSNDMRTLTEAAPGNPRAQLALDVYCYKLAKTISGMICALDQMDALVFTGGIGENASLVREKTLAHLASLGLYIDTERNQKPQKHAGHIHAADSHCPILVIATQEEQMIAQQTQTALQKSADKNTPTDHGGSAHD